MTTERREEMILAIRRSLFDELGAFQGLNFDVARYLSPILARENNFFVPRPRAELDPGCKQIIPYVLLTHSGRVLHYVRGKKGGEQRLVAKGSIASAAISTTPTKISFPTINAPISLASAARWTRN